jgi:hypothetical protein
MSYLLHTRAVEIWSFMQSGPPQVRNFVNLVKNGVILAPAKNDKKTAFCKWTLAPPKVNIILNFKKCAKSPVPREYKTCCKLILLQKLRSPQ